MRAVVAYESMYGNTRIVAEAIADGLRSTCSVTVVPVSHLEREQLDTAELIVIGAPTHVHGMSRANTRKAALEAAEKPGSGLSVEPNGQASGVREWLGSLERLNVQAAVFDTRIKMPAVVSGRASRGIAKELRRHSATLLTKPESFLVTKDNQLLPGEEDRARTWGRQLATALVGAVQSSGSADS
jgi:Flavodoxin domain